MLLGNTVGALPGSSLTKACGPRLVWRFRSHIGDYAGQTRHSELLAGSGYARCCACRRINGGACRRVYPASRFNLSGASRFAWRCGGVAFHSHLPFELYRAARPIRRPGCGVEVGDFCVRERMMPSFIVLFLGERHPRAFWRHGCRIVRKPSLMCAYLACAFSAGFPCGLPPARSCLEGFINSEAMMPTTPTGTNAQKASIGSQAPADIDALNGSSA